MANQSATQVDINLVSGLNLNKNKAEIRTDFAGFNRRNSPRYGGCVSPFFTKELSEASKTITDSNGNEYRVDGDGNFFVNDVFTKRLTKRGFKKSYITPPFASYKWTKYGDYSKFAYITTDGKFYVDGQQVGALQITANVGKMEIRDWGKYVVAVYSKSVHRADTAYYEVTTRWIICDTDTMTTTSGVHSQDIADGEGIDGAPSNYLVGYITVVGQTIEVDGEEKDCFIIQPNTAVKYTGHVIDSAVPSVVYGTHYHQEGSTSITEYLDYLGGLHFVQNENLSPLGFIVEGDHEYNLTKGHLCRDGYIYSYSTSKLNVKYNKRVVSIANGTITYSTDGYDTVNSDNLWGATYPYTPSFRLNGTLWSTLNTYSATETMPDSCVTARAFCSEWLYSYAQPYYTDMAGKATGETFYPSTSSEFIELSYLPNGTTTLDVSAIALEDVGSVIYSNGFDKPIAGGGFGTMYTDYKYYTREYKTDLKIDYNSAISGALIRHTYTIRQKLPYIGATYLGGLSVPLNSHFRLLINGNQPTGISYCNNSGDIGTLLTPWNSLNDDGATDIKVFGDKVVYYSSTEKKWVELSVDDTAFDFEIVEDSYIIFNTTDIDNVYIIASEDFDHYASDWNNRGTLGTPQNKTWGEETLISKACTGSVSASFASSYNNNYTSTGKGIISSQFQPTLLSGGVVLSDGAQPGTLYNANGSDIAVFYGVNEEVTSPEYSYTMSNGTKTTDLDLYEQLYVYASDSTQYIRCPSIFAQYIETMLTEDWIKDGKVYKLLGQSTDERVYILGYATVATNNAEVVFAIQGQPYIVSNRYIYAVSVYNNIISTSPVVKISNMQYIGNSPTSAFFYSPLNRVIYTFKGDRSLTPSYIASEIEAINLFGYDASTSTLYLVSDDKVYCFVDNVEGLDMYTIDIPNVRNIYFASSGISIVKADGTTILYSYNKVEGSASNKVEIETQYYGAGQNRVSVIDCYYIRLFSEHAVSGDVTCSVSTLTNVGRSNEERTFHITQDMWDKNTSTYYLRYQPSLQRGIGSSLAVTSDFPVMSITASVNKDSTVQISKGGI